MEHELARIATRQHGVVTRAQVLAAGASSEWIDRRLRKGALHRVHPGVYRVGHRAPSLEASCLAAVHACGAGALLCGRAAGRLHGLLRGAAPMPEVVAPTERRIAGVLTHRSRAMDRADRALVRRIPVTTVPRTLVDLAAVLSPDALGRACHEAQVLHRLAPDDVDAVLARRTNSPGCERLRRMLRGDLHITLSALERRFLSLLRTNALPLPQTNRIVDGRRVDCRWPGHRLTVELDGYRYHHSRRAWNLDRLREREARARGDDFRRYSFSDVFEDPAWMLAELSTLLAARRPV